MTIEHLGCFQARFYASERSLIDGLVDESMVFTTRRVQPGKSSRLVRVLLDSSGSTMTLLWVMADVNRSDFTRNYLPFDL